MTGYARDDVLTAPQVREALHIKVTKWKAERHKFPWSFVLGPRSARITWGQVLDVLAGEGQRMTLRRRVG